MMAFGPRERKQTARMTRRLTRGGWGG